MNDDFICEEGVDVMTGVVYSRAILTKQGSKMSKVWPGWCLQVPYRAAKQNKGNT